MEKIQSIIAHRIKNLMVFLAVLGPATIAAMSDNDAAGVATYAVAGAKLGYPILFILLWTTLLLGITQEMGIRLSLVTRKGLGDIIREQNGVLISLVIFSALFLANLGTIIVDISAFRIVAQIFHLPAIPLLMGIILLTFMFVVKGDYRLTQAIMLTSSIFYVTYIFSAFKAAPDWSFAIRNLAWPQGLQFTPEYWKNYIIIGLSVIGTTITPWGQFFISSFGLDKNIDPSRLKYSQLETYWGAFLTDFFSFFMIVATAATLFVHHIPLESGTQAALAIEPFAGKLAATLFALGIMNAGFMGIVAVGLSTTYAFSEFFGFSGSLDASYTQGKSYYLLFLTQLIIGLLVAIIPSINLFQIAVIMQSINAMMLPLIFYYLIRITSDQNIMGNHANTPFKKWVAITGTMVIGFASVFTLIATFLNL